MKRATCLLLTIILLISACACGVIPEESEKTSEPTPLVSSPERGKPDRSDLKYSSLMDNGIKTDWQGEWIWTESCSEDSYVAFRKSFELEEACPSATAFVSAESKYTLWVNGEMKVIDGSFKRGPTPVDCYYDEIELDGFHKGENNITVLVAFNGRSGYSSVTPVLKNEDGDEVPQAGLLFEMDIGGKLIKSDASWRAQRLPMYKNAGTGRGEYISYPQGVMLAERNIHYNAGDDIGNYTAPEFDDSGWQMACPIAKVGDEPFGNTVLSLIKPPRFYEITDFENSGAYTGKILEKDTILELPFPENCQFTFYFELDAEEGKRLTIYTDTYKFTDGGMPSFKDTYITKGGPQKYENYPWRSGTKLYIEAPSGVKFTKLGYRISEFNAEKTGYFISSDSRLTSLWQKGANTVNICLRDSFMDCPERERAAYAGDAANEGVSALYIYDGTALALIKKNLISQLGWTKTDGIIPSQAPGFMNRELPNQTLSFIALAYSYWMYSGDEETARAFFPAARDYLMLFDFEDGLPVHRAGDWDWEDWGDFIDSELLQIGMYAYCLRLMSCLAEELGLSESAEPLRERYDSIEKCWRARYYTTDGFKSPDARKADERASAMLILSGLAKGEDAVLATDTIKSTSLASPFMERFILEALGEEGRTDLLYARMMDRYAAMIDDEASTLWEKFRKEDGTFNHGWAAGPVYITGRYIAGIRPVKPGWEEYEIVPFGEMDSFKTNVWTPKGIISVEKTGGTITVKTPNASGRIIFQDGSGYDLNPNEEYCFREGL